MVICTTQLLFGKLLARYSVRWIYSISMLFFLVGSAVCGAAPNSHSLIIGRAIAGVGCSGLLVAAFSLVPILVAPAKRPILLGLLSGSRGLATTFGPLIGGVLTEKVSWRWNFYINLPIGAVIQIAFFFLVHPPKRDHEAFTSWTEFLKTLDLFGLVALLPSIVCLLLALQWGGLKYAWQDARVIVLLVLAGILAIAFISVEIWQGPNAMLPSRVFTQRTVSAASFFGFCTVSAIFVLTYYLPMYLPFPSHNHPPQLTNKPKQLVPRRQIRDPDPIRNLDPPLGNNQHDHLPSGRDPNVQSRPPGPIHGNRHNLRRRGLRPLHHLHCRHAHRGMDRLSNHLCHIVQFVQCHPVDGGAAGAALEGYSDWVGVGHVFADGGGVCTLPSLPPFIPLF